MGCKKNMIKLLLVVFNVIAVIIGLALLGIGAYAKYEFGDILSVSESSFTSIPAMLMIIGVLIFILGFLGCFGSFRENRVVLIIYTILLVLVLMGEIVAVILSFIYKSNIVDAAEEGLNNKVGGYIDGVEDDIEIMDKIQETLDCCGVHGPANYTENAKWVKEHGNNTVPASCCPAIEESDAKTCKLADSYTDGCQDVVVDALGENAGLIIGIVVGAILIQLVLVILGCVFCRRVARDGYKEV